MNWDNDKLSAANDPETPEVRRFGMFRDFKRRKVFRVMGAYAVTAWLILQVVDVVSGAFPVPDWTLAAVAVVLAIGFPIAAALSWAFQITPDGVKLDMTTLDGEPVNRWRLLHFIDVVIIIVLLVVLGFLTLRPEPAAPTNLRVAVLPLENLSGDSSSDYLGIGIADDIRTRLYELPQLLIAARTSSNVLAREGLDVRSIGERLGVEHVLEGSLHRDGNRIRVLMQLVDVDSGFAQWSKSFSSEFEDVLAMQNNISLVVASQLEIVLTADVREVLAKSPTDSVAAFDYYTQANEYMDRPASFDNLDLAASLYQKAIDVDQEFALGHAGLCRVDVRRFTLNSDTSAISRAEANCQKALELDTTLSQVHTSLGNLYLMTDRRDDARDAFETALDIDARSIGAFVGMGRIFMLEGNFVDAEARFKASIDAQPGNWKGYQQLGYFMYTQGRFEEVIDNYERVLELSPDNANALNNLGAAHSYLGNFRVAAENFEKSLAINPTRGALSNIGTMYYFAADYALAVDYFRRAAEEVTTDYRLRGNLADALRFVGDTTQSAADLYRTSIDMALGEVEVTGHTGASLTNLAWYHANLGEKENALSYLQEAEKLDALKSQELYTIALTYALLGNANEAEAAILKSKALGFPQSIVETTPELRELDRQDATKINE